jgi:hypothetical protein
VRRGILEEHLDVMSQKEIDIAKGYVDARCDHCGDLLGNHPGLWTLNTGVKIGDIEKVNTGYFEVCRILERRQDRINYVGHRVAPLDGCDEDYMKDISS